MARISKAGFWSSISYFFHRWIFKSKYLIADIPEYNLKIKFKTEDGGGRRMYKRGDYEPTITTFLTRHLRLQTDDIVLDVGANVGWYALLFSRLWEGRVQVHCFEPDPVNFECLKDNLQMNQSENVIIHQLAVGHQEEEKILYQYASKNTGRHSLLPVNEGKQLIVKVVRLDEYLKRIGISIQKVKFIKIDVEGYEYLALQGAGSLLESTPVIFAEYSPGLLKKSSMDPLQVLNLLYQHHYLPYTITESGPKNIAKEVLFKEKGTLNVLWVKNDWNNWVDKEGFTA
jgi:FkbM family methyltransferase